jgi:hypothetical protein
MFMVCNNPSQPKREEEKGKTKYKFNISYVISMLLFIKEKITI